MVALKYAEGELVLASIIMGRNAKAFEKIKEGLLSFINSPGIKVFIKMPDGSRIRIPVGADIEYYEIHSLEECVGG